MSSPSRSRPAVPRPVLAAVVAIALTATGCAPSATAPAEGGVGRPSEAVLGDVPGWLLPLPDGVDPATVTALAGLPPCEAEVETVATPDDVDGLRLPPGAEITEVTEDAPLVTVQGLIGATPVQLRVWLESREDLEILHAEDEVRESELLVGDGTHRMFVKAQAVCDQGSIFQAVVAPEIATDDLPSPGAP